MKKLLALVLSLVVCLSLTAVVVSAADCTAQYAAVKPVIDGDIDLVWDTTAEIDSAFLGDDDGEGISGYGKVLWDEDCVYFLAVVTDPTASTKSVTENKDSVDIWFSEANTQDADGYNGDGDYCLTINRAGADAANYYIGNVKVYDNATCAAKATATGYVVEAAVKYLTAGLNVTTGHISGFNMSFNNDLDDDGARDSWVSIQSYDNRPYWGNTSVLNTIEFVGSKPAETTAAPAAAETAAPAAAADTSAPAAAAASVTAAQTGDMFAVAVAAVLAAAAGIVISKKHS